MRKRIVQGERDGTDDSGQEQPALEHQQGERQRRSEVRVHRVVRYGVERKRGRRRREEDRPTRGSAVRPEEPPHPPDEHERRSAEERVEEPGTADPDERREEQRKSRPVGGHHRSGGRGLDEPAERGHQPRDQLGRDLRMHAGARGAVSSEGCGGELALCCGNYAHRRSREPLRMLRKNAEKITSTPSASRVPPMIARFVIVSSSNPPWERSQMRRMRPSIARPAAKAPSPSSKASSRRNSLIRRSTARLRPMPSSTKTALARTPSSVI